MSRKSQLKANGPIVCVCVCVCVFVCVSHAGEIDFQEFVSLVTRDEQRPLTPAKSPGKSIFKEA